jgi:hypothetical protein
MSALKGESDIPRSRSKVRFSPIADLRHGAAFSMPHSGDGARLL